MNIAVASSVYGLTTFNPRLSVSGETTDNLYLDNDNEVDEFILVPGADLELAVIVPTRGLEISYSPSYSFYNTYDEHNTFRQRAGLNLWSDLTRTTRFEITDAFLKTEDPLSEEDLTLEIEEEPLTEQDTTIRRGRQPYYTNTARGALIHRFGQTNTFSAAYEYSTLENEDPEVQDNKRYSPSVELTYWLNRQWGTETEAIFEKGDFETSDDFDNGIGRFRLIRLFTRNFQTFVEYTHTIMRFDGDSEDYNIYEPSLGFDWSMDEDSTLSLAVGYFFRDVEYIDKTGFTLDGDIGKRWAFRRSSFSLTGSSGYEQSYFGSENLGFSRYYEIAGTGRFEFTRRMSGGIFGSYRHTKYDDLADERKDKEPIAGCSLNYRVTEWLYSSLTYTYSAINSTNNEKEYKENRVMLIVSISPKQPYKL